MAAVPTGDVSHATLSRVRLWPQHLQRSGGAHLTLWTGSDRFGDFVTLAAGSSQIEPGVTPAKPLTLRWETFTEAANEAGVSRRYGGTHFARADMAGRKLGGLVADRAWAKAQTYFDGINNSPIPELPASQ